MKIKLLTHNECVIEEILGVKEFKMNSGDNKLKIEFEDDDLPFRFIDPISYGKVMVEK